MRKRKKYNGQIQVLSEKKQSDIERKIIRYFKSKTYKLLLAGIDMFYDELIINYLSNKHKYGKGKSISIPSNAIRKSLITKSSYKINNLFENLNIINDKKKILTEILKENPREERAYWYIIENGFFDLEVLVLAKVVCIEYKLRKGIENALNYEHNRSENLIVALALLSDKSTNEILDDIVDNKKEA